jgi:uncharacterized membrane protein
VYDGVAIGHSGRKTMRIASLGHAVFAGTMIALGILGLIKPGFVPIWSGAPTSWPAQDALAYLCALVSLACGIGLLWERTALLASRVLLVYLLVWMLLFRVSHAVVAPAQVVTWWACGESAVLVAAAWVLYAWFAGEGDGPRLPFATGEKGVRVARVFYGLGLIPFGIAHFIYLKETVVLVPGWLPWHTGWAYLTGWAFIAAGVAVVIGVFARLAATLSAWQMGLFTLLIWVPMAVAGSPTPFQWGEFVDSCTLTAAAWVVGDSYRAVPWLAMGRVASPMADPRIAR